MRIREEIRMKRKEYFATATTKEKIKYLIDYYGWLSMGLALILAFIIFGIVEVATAPEPVINGAFINLSQYGENFLTEELGKEFLKELNVDTKKYSANFSDNLIISSADAETTSTTHQVLMVHMSGGMLDFIVASPENLITYAYDDLFVDLTTVLTEEEIEAYKPYFLYVDAAITKERNEGSKSLEELADYVYPDMTKPEDMKEPIPVFLDLSDNERMKELYNAKKLNISFCIVSTGKNQENTVKFLNFLMK